MSVILRQAVVLCAGLAKRLGPLAERQPKAMLSIAGQPIIEHIVTKLLDKARFSQVVLVIGAGGGSIRRLFQSDDRVQFAVQPSPKGTADALLAAGELLDERFLLTYGDLWVTFEDYRGMRRDAEMDNNQRLAINDVQCPKGAAVYLNGRHVEKIVEKPDWHGQPDTHWNASGLYVLNRAFVDDCRNVKNSPRGELELTSAIQGAIDRGARFLSYKMSQPQIDLGTPERYHALCETLSKLPANSGSDSAVIPKPWLKPPAE